MFRDAVKTARDYGIRMAVENHIDFTSDEMVTLLDAVDSPYLGINFDTGNFLRLLDDPVKGMDKLANRVTSKCTTGSSYRAPACSASTNPCNKGRPYHR
jgi:sugar phosphate isomerase/epimerase